MKQLSGMILACAVLSACASTSQNQVTLKVASAQIDCIGVAPQQCLLVQEVTDTQAMANRDWEFFYSDIGGFEYEPGFEYMLLINKIPRERVAADQSATIYHLEKVLMKRATTSENMPQTFSMTNMR